MGTTDPVALSSQIVGRVLQDGEEEFVKMFVSDGMFLCQHKYINYSTKCSQCQWDEKKRNFTFGKTRYVVGA